MHMCMCGEGNNNVHLCSLDSMKSEEVKVEKAMEMEMRMSVIYQQKELIETNMMMCLPICNSFQLQRYTHVNDNRIISCAHLRLQVQRERKYMHA